MLNSALVILLQALGAVLFFNRFIAGVALRLLKKESFDEADYSFEPTVTVVVPMYNEGASIRGTVASLLALEYPAGKLEVVVVDDCSTDDSFAHASAMVAGSGGRLRVLRNKHNLGKRKSINRVVLASQAEIIVSVDSDVVVDRRAVRELVARFVRPEIAAVGGWVDVRNKSDNWLTRMQTIKYFFSYHFLKNLEWAFRRVMCLSGCLTAYRRNVLVELHPVLEHREICGVPIKYGEDRFLTRHIIKAGHLTTMTLKAVCWTAAPTRLDDYFAQQLRWRRSNIVDYFGALSHVWSLNPVIAVHYFALFAMILAYPALLVTAVAKGQLFSMLTRQVIVTAVIGLGYWWKVRKLPIERVHPLWFVSMAVILPVIYAILTPLALFTLDSGSWETRHHTEEEPEPSPEPRDRKDTDALEDSGDAVPARPMLDSVAVTSSAISARAERPAA